MTVCPYVRNLEQKLKRSLQNESVSCSAKPHDASFYLLLNSLFSGVYNEVQSLFQCRLNRLVQTSRQRSTTPSFSLVVAALSVFSRKKSTVRNNVLMQSEWSLIFNLLFACRPLTLCIFCTPTDKTGVLLSSTYNSIFPF